MFLSLGIEINLHLENFVSISRFIYFHFDVHVSLYSYNIDRILSHETGSSFKNEPVYSQCQCFCLNSDRQALPSNPNLMEDDVLIFKSN